MDNVNSDGKANLDILSSVKYGEELLNEQLIPRRYGAPAETGKWNSTAADAAAVVSLSPFPLCGVWLIARPSFLEDSISFRWLSGRPGSLCFRRGSFAPMMEMKKNLEPEPRVLVQSPRKAKCRC